ncbi:MAG: hypothetical protein DRN92_06465, partial [Thermoproteota archaeon]
MKELCGEYPVSSLCRALEVPRSSFYYRAKKGLQITHPDQVWCGDIAYIRLKDRFAYFAFLMDVYTRAIRGWQISFSLDEELVVRALQKALEKAKPQIHHSDHGIQYLSDRYVSLLRDAGVEISMAGKGRAWENSY